MHTFDVTILTESRYVAPGKQSKYIRNILREDQLVQSALERKGLNVRRINWDHPDENWSDTKYILFRSTWDYFDRFSEFSIWLEAVKDQTSMVNPYKTIKWNLDKHYLLDISNRGVNIPPTLFIDKGDGRSLKELISFSGWKEIILKPVISGAARHTYRILPESAEQHEELFTNLIMEESFMIQEFQVNVPSRGEVAFMLFDGRYTHAILKKAKKGDFRVQDDFGGTVQHYEPSSKEIAFAEQVVSACFPVPIYARVDVIWDNQDRLAVSELELIEPELWFRFHPPAADKLAEAFMKMYR